MVSKILLLFLPVILLLSSKTMALPLAVLHYPSCLEKKLRKAVCSREILARNYTEN